MPIPMGLPHDVRDLLDDPTIAIDRAFRIGETPYVPNDVHCPWNHFLEAMKPKQFTRMFADVPHDLAEGFWRDPAFRERAVHWLSSTHPDVTCALLSHVLTPPPEFPDMEMWCILSTWTGATSLEDLRANIQEWRQCLFSCQMMMDEIGRYARAVDDAGLSMYATTQSSIARVLGRYIWKMGRRSIRVSIPRRLSA